MYKIPLLSNVVFSVSSGCYQFLTVFPKVIDTQNLEQRVCAFCACRFVFRVRHCMGVYVLGVYFISGICDGYYATVARA